MTRIEVWFFIIFFNMLYLFNLVETIGILSKYFNIENPSKYCILCISAIPLVANIIIFEIMNYVLKHINDEV